MVGIQLANAGGFTVNESSFWVEYENILPYSKYVIHPSYMIIGHKSRGWKPVNEWVKRQSTRIVPIFKQAAIAAWNEQELFMYSGGSGL